jgi:hypothetical protein
MSARIAAALILSILPGWAADMSCLTCHEKQKKEFAVSVHGEAGVTCVDCHGGNPSLTNETAHVTDNFKRPDNKKAIAELCASCHSDIRKMNPYGIPADQLERYKTSKHGTQLFEHDDQKVATCTDCHGVHDILKAKSPQARTYPSNIPATCGRCHSDEKLMSQYKLPADVVAQYKTSYHAYMVLEKGDLSAPTCITCHGNHGATPPGTAEVGQVCGKCHGRQRDLFEKSPHAEAAKAGAFSECVSCHGNHAIQKASVVLFGKACVQCHASDPKQLALRDQLVGMIESSKGAFERAKLRVHDATVQGLATEDEQLLLQEANTQITQLEAMQHTLKQDEMRPAATRAEDVVADILRDVNHLERVEQLKRHALVPIWIFLGVMAVIFWAKRRQLS